MEIPIHNFKNSGGFDHRGVNKAFQSGLLWDDQLYRIFTVVVGMGTRVLHVYNTNTDTLFTI